MSERSYHGATSRSTMKDRSDDPSHHELPADTEPTCDSSDLHPHLVQLADVWRRVRKLGVSGLALKWLRCLVQVCRFKPHCRKREILVIVTGFKWLRCLVQVCRFKPHCRKREILVIVTGFKWLRCLVQVCRFNSHCRKREILVIVTGFKWLHCLVQVVGSNHTTGKEKYWLMLQVLNGFVALYKSSVQTTLEETRNTGYRYRF